MSIEVLIVDVAEDFSPAIKKSCQWFWQSRIAGKFSIASLRYQGGGRVRLRIRSSGKHLREPHGAQQIPPLRCAPVGMTRGEGWLRSDLRVGRRETADPSTSVGMTRGEGWLRSELKVGRRETADPSTSVGMTILLQGSDLSRCIHCGHRGEGTCRSHLQASLRVPWPAVVMWNTAGTVPGIP